MDAALAVVLSDLDGIFSLKEKRKALKAFLGRQPVFTLLPTLFDKSLAKRLRAPRLATGRSCG